MNKIPLVMILLIFKGQCFAAAHDNRQRAQQLPVGIERLPVELENSFRARLRAAGDQQLRRVLDDDSQHVVEGYLRDARKCLCYKEYVDGLETCLFYERVKIERLNKGMSFLFGTTCVFGGTTLLFAGLWAFKKNS
jgi:hypothetical protein